MGGEEVELYIYDMAPVVRKRMGIAIPAKKVWHSSIVVFGKEYSYGMDGVTISDPHEGKIYDTVTLGYTPETQKALEKYIEVLEEDWNASSYHLWHHNCHHFVELLIQFLELDTSDMPSYLLSLPEKLGELSPEDSIQSKIVDACANFFVQVFGSGISGGSRTNKYYNN